MSSVRPEGAVGVGEHCLARLPALCGPGARPWMDVPCLVFAVTPRVARVLCEHTLPLSKPWFLQWLPVTADGPGVFAACFVCR